MGLLIGLLGVAFALTPIGHNLEEQIGLGLLFTMRGKRPPPPDVAIVAIDESSSDRLNLPLDSKEWPRSYQAKLVQKLNNDGASLIVFDLVFDESRPKEDPFFADQIRAAGNVLLLGYLRMEGVPLSDPSGKFRSEVIVEKMIPPTAVLAREARSISPFPLPKIPVNVNQFWTFKEGTGDLPTLPAAAFQLFALKVQDDLVRLMKKALADPKMAQASNPVDRAAAVEAERIIDLKRQEIKGPDGIDRLIRSMKKIFRRDTLISEIVTRELSNPNTLPAGKNALLKALIEMYKDGDSRYLNFYGPAQTIPTVPYFKALESHEASRDGKGFNFKGKVVFIGVSDLYPHKQGDTYRTYFSQPNGVDLSGVEIAATAFANLREGSMVRPLGFYPYLATVSLFGFGVGMICFFLRPLLLTVFSVGLILMYMGLASYQFKTAGLWFPVVVPIGIQGPFAFLSALLCRYLDARKLEVAHARLKEMDRVKSMFLSHVSHELKTPLASIKGFVENMLDGITGELKVKQREYLNRVQANTVRLSRMITNLLDLSRIEAGTQRLDRVPLRLYDLTLETVELFRLTADAKQMTLAMICPDPTIQILADRDKFVQVITNLIDNAIKFTPAGGKITITIERPEPERVMMTVSDTGEGIPENAMKNLFQPFYQASRETEARAKGLGLGLSIVKTLVELHGGTISVKSAVGRGTEFRILMPSLKLPDADLGESSN